MKEVHIWFVATLALVLSCANALASEKHQAQLKVVSVAKRILRTKSTNGFLLLEIKNVSDAPITLIQSGCWGIGASAQQRKTIFGGAGGEFAEVEYEWKKGEKLVLSGTYETGGLPLQIYPQAARFLFVPIKLPRNKGSYRLFVSFNNKHLQQMATSMAEEPAECKYLKIETSQVVSITE
jgi:hypothetical protein